MFISSRTVLVVTHTHTHTHTHTTCYTRYSCHDKPAVRTPLYNLEGDGKDISMGLKEPILSTKTGFIWHWMGIEYCCKHGSELSRSIKLGKFIDWWTSCCLPKIAYYMEFVIEMSVWWHEQVMKIVLLPVLYKTVYFKFWALSNLLF
jgi:hypothetical protein